MAEPISIQQLKDASLDVKSLEEVVNGDENVVVTTRLGETYPSVKGSIKKVFENGGLPAVPFATKALMMASALIDGDYAQVTDDTVNNGLYVKTGGSWVKSKYDISIMLNQEITKLKQKIIKNSQPVEFIDGATVLASPADTGVVLSYRSGFAYIKIDVNNVSSFEVANAIDVPEWRWVFTDKSGNRTGLSPNYGNGTFIVPEGSYYAYRTVKWESNGKFENPNLIIYTEVEYKSLKELEESIATIRGLEEAEITRLDDAVVLTHADDTKPYGNRVGFKAIRIDVIGAETIKVESARTDIPEWKWAFADKSGNRIGLPLNYGNGVFEVPEGAVYAYRTVHWGDSVQKSENSSMRVLINRPLKRTITALSTALDKIIGEPTPIVLKFIDGFVIKAAPDDKGNPVEPRSGFAYIKIEVDGADSFEVANAIDVPEWRWVFTDKDENRVGLSDNYGNGTFTVPKGAAYAYRTVKWESNGKFENPNLIIKVNNTPSTLMRMIKDIEVLYDKTSDRKELISYADLSAGVESTELRYTIRRMQEQFKNGDMLKLSSFEGGTSDAKLRNAIAYIKKVGSGILDLETGVHEVNSALLLPSHCWIYLNNSTLKLADGVFDNIIRNDGIVVGSGHGDLATEVNENVNIRVLGYGASKSVISGNAKNPYKAPHPISGGDAIPWLGDYFGWRTLGIYFNNTKHFEISNFHLKDANCWAISVEHGCENFEIHDIGFDTYVKNGDGVDVRMGTKNGRVYNIFGRTGDDMVALTAIRNWQTTLPSGNYIYHMQVAGFDDIGHGVNIENIDVYNIVGGGLHQGVRVLASGGAKVKDIRINKVADGGVLNYFKGNLVLVSSGYGETASVGDISRVFINDIESNGSAIALRLINDISDSHFNNIRQMQSGKTNINNTGARLHNVTITNAQ